MSRTFLKRAVGAGVALATAVAAVAVAAAPAPAASTTIVAAGSDTTQFVMGAILPVDQASAGATVFNVLSGQFQTNPLTVPADTTCNSSTAAAQFQGAGGAYIYHNISATAWPASGAPNQAAGETAAPDGSTNGKNALADANTGASPYNGGGANTAPNGCVAIARSSSGPSPGAAPDLATFEYYAYAVDGVTWGTTSLNAPAVLTQSQLQAIYNCQITNWSQVGGSPGPIQRVLPQNGSGTLKFFLSNVLGTAQGNLPASATNCPAIEQIQENQFFDLYHGSSQFGPPGNAATYPNAIGPYSAGQWSFQSNHSTNPTVDLRAGFRPGALTVAQGTGNTNAYGVTWTGTNWQLNNATVVGSATPAPRSENLTTTAGSNVVTLVPTTHTRTGVSVTTGSFTVTATAGTFNQNDVNSPVTDTTTAANLQASTVIAGVGAAGDTATLSKSAAGTGASDTLSLSSHFNAGDVGAALSGNANIPGGATITFVTGNTQATISTGTGVTAGTGVATTITPTGQVQNITGSGMVTTTGGTSTTITLTGGQTFNASDQGATIDGNPNLFPGTVITSVTGGSSTATISPGAQAAGSSNAAIGFPAVSQGNVAATVGASAPWPGARFVYNVVDSHNPKYTTALALVGFQDQVGGTKSPLCSGAHDLNHGGSDSLIADNGFLPLNPQTSAGGNTNVTCFKLQG